MSNREIFAMVLGAVGIAVFLFCFQFKDMKTARKIKMAVDIIWGAHYFLLGGYAAFAINIVCFFREIVFINSDKKFFSGKKWLYIFVTLRVTVDIRTRCHLFFSALFAPDALARYYLASLIKHKNHTKITA